MKPEKMTDEALAGICQRMESGETMTAVEQRTVLAHLAALASERDEARKQREELRGDIVGASEFAFQGGTGEPRTQEGRDALESIGRLWNERAALRERVQALEENETHLKDTLRSEQEHIKRLEAELGALEILRCAAHEARRGVESRLSAIHQRAANGEWLIRAYSSASDGRHDSGLRAVARYVVGDDATGANVCEHGDHPAPEGQRFCSAACETCAGVDHEGDGCARLCAMTPLERICEHDVAPGTTCHPPASTNTPDWVRGPDAFTPQERCDIVSAISNDATAAPPRRCSACPHAPHVGLCGGRNGGTANPCPCARTSLPASPEPVAHSVNVDVGPDGGMRFAPPEPSTAEAFATMRTLVTGVPRGAEVSSTEGERLLSLLARRMGAMGRVVEDWLNTMRADGYSCCCEDGDQCPLCRCAATLTDAPAVFTLEEVEKAILDAAHSKAADGVHSLKVGINTALNAVRALRK